MQLNLSDRQKTTLQEARDEIESVVDCCACSIVKSCETCKTHLHRVDLVKRINELLDDVGEKYMDFRPKDGHLIQKE